jgi:hypothetical protein
MNREEHDKAVAKARMERERASMDIAVYPREQDFASDEEKNGQAYSMKNKKAESHDMMIKQSDVV